MQTQKACTICQKKIANYSCIMCGAIVCKDHYNHSKHLCPKCDIGNLE